MNATFELNQTVLNRKIAELHDAMVGQGADASTIIQDQGRLLLKQCIKFTPPKTNAQGRAAVARDIGRAANPLTADKFRNPKLRARFEALTEEDWHSSNQEIQDFLRNSKFNRNARVETFSPQLHKQARGSRGRVSKSQNVYVLEVAAWKKYVAEMQRRVGRMKAAWAETFVALGGKVPSWISRHLPTPKGGILANTLGTSKPSITFQSRAPGIGQFQRQFSEAMRARAQAITRQIKGVLSGYSAEWKAGMRIKRGAKKTATSFYAGD